MIIDGFFDHRYTCAPAYPPFRPWVKQYNDTTKLSDLSVQARG